MGAISYFPGGGGAKLKATAYAAAANLPASAKEGVFAVITSTVIGDVYVSADVPSSPASGDIRVWTGGRSRAPIALTDLFTVHPRACYQYNGSSWVLRESYVYTDGTWVELSLAIYDYGAEILSNMTARSFGGNQWSSVEYTEQTAAVYARRLNNGDWGYRCYSTDVPIDLTDISTIRLTYTKTSSDFAMTLYISGTNASYLATASVNTGTGTVVTTNLDVSAYTGLYYIGMYCGAWNETGGNGYIYKIELIP